jgi:predicted SpoU family rRNA methylase
MDKHKAIYHSYYETLVHEKQYLQNQLDEFYHHGIKVDVTMYQPTYYQTDKTPNITADGTKIRIDRASNYNFVALSRNLLKRWGGPFDYGDYILLKGAKNKDGVYQVRDTMNEKWVNVVDILESKHVAPYKFKGCNIIKLPWAQENA